MIIRPVEKADLDTVAKIKVETWNNSYKGIVDNIYLEKMDYKKTANKWLKNFNNENFIVAVADDQIMGFCRYGNRIDEIDRFKDYDGEIYAIYIDKRFQRQGIGNKMVEYACNELKKQNKNKRKITVIPIQKIIVSVPAQNDITPKYIVHTKNKTNITI